MSEENKPQEAQTQPLFAVEKLYVKDLSLEVPHAPEVFLQQEPPQVSIQLGTGAKQVENGIFEVVLTATVTAELKDTTVFLVEVGQAGIFRVQNIPEDQIDPLLAIACPTVLFPYAREVVSDAITRAGFPPVILQPVNFEHLYMQKMQEEEAARNAQKAE